MHTDDTHYLNSQQVAQLLGLAANTLAKWRLSGIGPRYSKLGRRVVYQRSEIDEWLAGNRYRSTSEYGLKARGGSE